MLLIFILLWGYVMSWSSLWVLISFTLLWLYAIAKRR